MGTRRERVETKLPDLTPALVERLNELFPERSPEEDWSEAKCKWEGGQRSVIRFINQQYENQHKTVPVER